MYISIRLYVYIYLFIYLSISGASWAVGLRADDLALLHTTIYIASSYYDISSILIQLYMSIYLGRGQLGFRADELALLLELLVKPRAGQAAAGTQCTGFTSTKVQRMTRGRMRQRRRARQRQLGPQQLCLRSGWWGVHHLLRQPSAQHLEPSEEAAAAVYNIHYITYNI